MHLSNLILIVNISGYNKVLNKYIAAGGDSSGLEWNPIKFFEGKNNAPKIDDK